MTTRRKSKQQYESTSIDEKEHADRIAAAEAMSCLSSMVVLPSNSDELFALGADVYTAGTNTGRSQNGTKSVTSNANKKGKTRSRAAKNSPPSTSKKVTPMIDKGTSSANKQKVPKYAPTLAVNSKKHNKLPDQVLSLTINPKNPNHDQKRMEMPKNSKHVDQHVLQPTIITPAFIQADQSGLSKQCIIQVDHNKPGLCLYNLSSTDLQKILDGKLPFQVKSDSPESQNIAAKHIASKLVNLVNTEVVDLGDNLTHVVLKQKYEGKESSECSLPLKKRRLQGYKEDDPQITIIEDGQEKVTEQETSSPKPEGISVSTERVKPVAVDPTTSLMLLNEMQIALQQDEDGDLPLHIAVVHENIVMVQKFVHLMSISGKSVDKYNKAQQTPLHIAVELKFVQAVHTLLLAGSNPNLVNKNGENCIHMAVKANSLECLQLIFKFSPRPDVNARNFDGLAPIHVAVIKNNMEIVKFLLAEKADVNIQDGKSGRTPLFYAVEGNIIPMVELFQKVGANLDLPNYASITAVMAAQARGFHEVASMLLRCMDSKAYLEMKEKEKGTPLKKVPIPRIPSKSHLIQADTKAGMVDLQQLTNSDSEDSVQSNSNSRKRTKSIDVRKEQHVQENDVTKLEKIQTNSKTLENGVQESKKEIQNSKQDNSEGILISRELLERLQNTMLTLLAMQKVQQTPNNQLPGTSSTSPSVATLPIQSTGNVNLSNILHNAISTNNSSVSFARNIIGDSGTKNIIKESKNVNINKTRDMSKDQKVQNLNAQNEKMKENKTRHIMLQELLNVNKSDLDKSLEKSQKTKESVIERSTLNRQKLQETCRVEEPMDVSESGGGSPDSSQQSTSSKFGKSTGVGHAAMNQLGRVTSVSTSLQATLLQMLQAKQNKPLNLTTNKDNTNVS